MRKLVYVCVAATLAILAAHDAGALDPFHEDLASGGLDPDGDHYLTTGGVPSNDPQPSVFCSTAHADVPAPNPSANRNGAITLQDYAMMVQQYGTVPASPFYDQNHNDVVDWPDVNHVGRRIGTLVSNACTSTIPGVIPVSTSAYEGGVISFFPPSPPPSGQFTVSVNVGSSPNLQRGYFVKMYFNENSVQAVSASASGGYSLCPPNITITVFIDNTDDEAGDDGSIGVGCVFNADSFGSHGLTLTFDRISSEEPNFELRTCGAPDNAGTLGGSYTISADDHGPQVGPGEDPCEAFLPPAATLAIDANPSNGAGACDVVDPTTTVWVGLSYDVAVCLVDGAAPSALDFAIRYNGSLHEASDVAPDGGNDLDSNPDLNGGNGSGIGSGWDCSLGGVNPPNGTPQPATLACAGTAGLSGAGHIATMHMTATDAGVDQVRLLGGSTVDSSACNANGGAACRPAIVRILPPPQATCDPVIIGATPNGLDYTTRANSPLVALGRIPTGKSTATVNVRRADNSILASATVNGQPGAVVEVPFVALPPSPLSVECVVPGMPNEVTSIQLFLIDPSGRIYDIATDATIVGATVVLETDSDPGPGQAWVAMSPATHAGYFEPPINPELTGLDGRYAWDVAPYYPQPLPDPTNDYRVQVSAPGCSPATSSVVTVPPPVTTLHVGLTCTDTDGDGISDVTETTLLGSDPSSADTDGDGTPDDLEDSDGDGLGDLEELVASTNLLDSDSDNDTLSDFDELTDHLTNALAADTENDGCSDAEELGATTGLGGNRNPLSPNDFFDVPTPANGGTGLDGKLILSATASRNKAIALTDVGVVLAYVGRTATGAPGNTYYNGDLNGDGLADGAQMDRTPASPMGSTNLGPPNGAISLQDVGVALTQVGHNCTAAP